MSDCRAPPSNIFFSTRRRLLPEQPPPLVARDSRWRNDSTRPERAHLKLCCPPHCFHHSSSLEFDTNCLQPRTLQTNLSTPRCCSCRRDRSSSMQHQFGSGGRGLADLTTMACSKTQLKRASGHLAAPTRRSIFAAERPRLVQVETGKRRVEDAWRSELLATTSSGGREADMERPNPAVESRTRSEVQNC